MKHKLLTRLLITSLSVAMVFSATAQALTLEEAQDLIVDYYIHSIPASAWDQTEISSLLTELGDPYTVYLTAEEYAAFSSTMEDSAIAGIGVTANIIDEGALLESIVKGSPAEEGGLQTGDLITAVDQVSIAGLDSVTITDMLRGEIGTTVRITYQRDNQAHTTFLTRAEVVIAATTTTLIDDHIGYIDCTTFGSDTLTHFEEGLAEYGEDADRWILDLTGNGGGDVSAATQSAACFTGPGYTAFLQDAQGQYGTYYPTNEALTLAPVIVLTDSATASASELYASAIRDRDAGLVVGWRTFGKGTAQIILDENNYPSLFDGDALKISAYRFYSADGNSTNAIGVIPHLMVDPNLADDVAILLSESTPTGDTSNFLRIDFGWRWYVDLDKASSEDYLPAFTALLEAMPSSIPLWQGLGDADDWSSTTVETLADLYDLELIQRSFTDIDASPYAQEIDALATYYILQGMGDGTFDPTAELTRGQLCSMLAQGLNCFSSEGGSTFTDVPSDHPYSAAIYALVDMGLVNGVTEDTFLPDAPVTHEQYITIMGRLAELLNMDFSITLATSTEESRANDDLSTYASWSESYVWLLGQSQSDYFGNSSSLLWDDLSAIDPSATTTREEAAYLLYSVLSYTGILPI